MSFGLVMALLGVVIAVGFAGIGSAMGVGIAGKAAAGVLSEKPELYGRTLILQALSGTQGIYGFLVGILIMAKIGILGSTPVALDAATGFSFLMAGLPIGIVGFVSAVYQGKASAAGILMTAKNPSLSVRGMTMAALVETYAILALLISILIYIAIPV